MGSVLVVWLDLKSSNEEILEKMATVKTMRESGAVSNVVCTIAGFDDDSRELWEIPEARAFCRRLVGLGFISYLDFETTIPDTGVPEACQGSLGAFEVWLMSESRMTNENVVTIELVEEAKQALIEANEKCDRVLGPYREQQT